MTAVEILILVLAVGTMIAGVALVVWIFFEPNSPNDYQDKNG